MISKIRILINANPYDEQSKNIDIPIYTYISRSYLNIKVDEKVKNKVLQVWNHLKSIPEYKIYPIRVSKYRSIATNKPEILTKITDSTIDNDFIVEFQYENKDGVLEIRDENGILQKESIFNKMRKKNIKKDSITVAIAFIILLMVYIFS